MLSMLAKHKEIYFKKIITIACVLFFLLVAVFFIQTLSKSIGNIFFGGVPKLYNLTFAKFFYSLAGSPIVGIPQPFVFHQLSRTYFIQGKYEQALYFARKEMEMYPENRATLYIEGLTLGYMGREREAIIVFAKYIEFNPKSWAARNDKAWLEFRIGEIDEAVITIEPVSGMVGNPWVQNTYGTLLMNKLRYDEAAVAFFNAKIAISKINEYSWGSAYPGNDPRVYVSGLQSMRTSIEKNIELNLARRTAGQ